MKLRFLFVFVVAQLSASAQMVIKVSTDTFEVFSFSEGDEFNGSLDEITWKNGLGGRRVLMAQDLAFSPDLVQVKDGLIRFVAAKRDSTYDLSIYEVDSSFLKKTKRMLPERKWTTLYAAGAIVSRKKYHYGFYELRFKVDEGKGVWPAFWFYGGNKNEEIDVFELKGERNDEVHVDVHCPSGCAHGYRKTKFSFPGSYGGWMPLSKFLHDGFNIMMFEWKEDELIWYINGYPLAYYRGKFSNPMSLFLNTSVAKTGEAFSPGPDEATKWPNNYYVDYLRIWKPVQDSIPQLGIRENFTTSTAFPSDYTANPKRKKGLLYRKKKLNTIEGVITVTMSEKGKLNLKVLGRMADLQSPLTIKGSKTSTVVNAGPNDIVVDVDPGDKTLEIGFKNSCKSFVQRIVLK